MKLEKGKSPQRQCKGDDFRWEALALLFFFLGCTSLALIAKPGTKEYRGGQSALLTFSVIAAMLIPLRIRLWRVIQLHRHTRYEANWGPYPFSGRFFLDLYIALVVVVDIFLLDLSFWPQHAIRLGAVSILAVVSVAVSALFNKWKKRGGGGDL